MSVRVIVTGLLLSGILLGSCFPIDHIRRVDKASIPVNRTIETATKVHLIDGSVILYEQGFEAKENRIRGEGIRYNLARTAGTTTYWSVPLDSVAGLEYYDKSVPGARSFAGLLVALSVLPAIKIVFGSCPTVYTSDGAHQQLEAECFSRSIGRRYERADLDRLESRGVLAGRYTIRLKNEALETHYIDDFSLAYVDHPVGTEVFPVGEGDALLAADLVSPLSVTNSERRDVTSELRYRDNVAYGLDTAAIRRLFTRHERDWLECRVVVPRDAREITLALRGRNSLQSTVLLYDVMMRDQGLAVMDWSATLNTNFLYAWQLSRWYNGFSGMDVAVEHNGRFENVERIADTGPIAWKPLAVRVPLGEHGDTVRVRLSMAPDSWIVDWIGFDTAERNDVTLHDVHAAAIVDQSGRVRPDATRSISGDDGHYLVTYPGEWMDLTFDLPPATGNRRTLFVRSKGYYVEWVRPEWISDREDVPGFDLSEPAAIRQRLADLWIARKMSFEQEFIDYKVPTVEPEKSW